MRGAPAGGRVPRVRPPRMLERVLGVSVFCVGGRHEHEDMPYAAPGIQEGVPEMRREGVDLLVRVGQETCRRGRASGRGCNCLIHSLGQVVGEYFPVVLKPARIRAELQQRFPEGRESFVGESTYLDLYEHWRAVVELIGHFSAEAGVGGGDIVPGAVRVVCVVLRGTVLELGDVLGEGEKVLYLLNEQVEGGYRGVHFDPLLRVGAGAWRA